MRMVATEHVKPGMVTAAAVFPEDDTGNLPLVAGGVLITEALLGRIQRAGIEAVPIDDEFSKGIEFDQPITDETRRRSLSQVRSAFERIRSSDGVISNEDLLDLEQTIAEVLTEVADRRNMLIALSDLSRYGGGRLGHAVNVVVMGLAIGRKLMGEEGWRDYRGDRRMDRLPERLQKLGVGLLLLDVGALWVPESIWEKHGVLTAEERQLMQEHPGYGVEMLRGASDVSPLVTVTVGQHHERFDGSGFPRALAGSQVHDFAQIAGIADQYLRMATETDQGPPSHAPHDAYRIIVRAAGRLFSEPVIRAFREAIAPFGPGTCVALSDGTFGVIVRNSSEDPLRPIVRVTHGDNRKKLARFREVDLSTVDDVDIVAATGGLPSDRAGKQVTAGASS